jgi:hypothetical protein
MKKLLLFFCVVLFCISCVNDWWNYYTTKVWAIENHTNRTLVLRCPYSESESRSNPVLASDFEYREFKAAPTTRTVICKSAIPLEHEPWFDFYFTKSVEAFGENVSWQIFSEDGEMLKTWNYSNKDLSDQRFFDRFAWDDTREWGLWGSFTFDIRTEDIQP